MDMHVCTAMNVESMISPTSVAVLGASNRRGSVGNAVIANIEYIQLIRQVKRYLV
jgi:acyl-CoA synthetase (NDP forming)